MLENVEKFSDWGLLLENGRPDAKRRGQYFRRWHTRIQNLGYEIDMRELRACAYGAGTIRKGLFVIARCDGEEIVFPEETHGPGRLPYRTAAECIDLSLLCPSIFEPGRDVVANTLRRIARGIQRFVVEDPNPFVVSVGGRMVAATLINTRNGERICQAPRIRDIREPLPTVTAVGSQGALVVAFLAKHFGGNETPGPSLRSPMSTITSRDHHALVYAFLLKYYGTDQNPRLDQPLHTITTKDRFALVTVRGEQHQIADVCMRHLTPRELARSTSFRDDYILDPTHEGKRLVDRIKCGWSGTRCRR